MDQRTIQNERERHLHYALGLMCGQYLEDQDAKTLDHQCMSAGEEAYKALEAYGLIEVEGRGAAWTALGEELLASRLNQQVFPA